MKYVILNNRHPFLFPDWVSHKHIAEVMKDLLKKEYSMYTEPTSAGFVEVQGEIKCSGESVSLNLKPNPKDEAIINFNLKKIE
ncbi:MAG: hypothetical protein QW156_04715 [Candidatus Aenigmatarchaeota archaeon]